MATDTQRNQVFLGIVAGVTAKPLVMNFEVRHRFARLKRRAIRISTKADPVQTSKFSSVVIGLGRWASVVQEIFLLERRSYSLKWDWLLVEVETVGEVVSRGVRVA